MTQLANTKVCFLQQECFINFFNYIMYMQASLIYNNVNVQFIYYIIYCDYTLAYKTL
jgi:hypothetical protein